MILTVGLINALLWGRNCYDYSNMDERSAQDVDDENRLLFPDGTEALRGI